MKTLPRFIASAAVAAVLLCAGAFEASAHLGTLSYSDVEIRSDSVGYRLKFAAHLVPGSESTRNPSRAEVVRAESTILDWLGRTIVIKAGERPCKPFIDELVGPDSNADLTVVLGFECPAPTESLRIEFHPFDEALPDYSNIVSVRTAKESLGFVFTRDTPVLAIGRGAGATVAGAGDGFRRFFTLGAMHIWTSYDHLLFLLALLLPGGNIVRIAGIVGAFAIAHSITLALGTTGLAEAPPALVSLTVAASVAVAAAFVLRERREDRRWLLAFVFGLAHGFGLAAVLRASGPLPGGVALPLLAFNAGVETAQVVAVVIVVALLRMLGE